METKKNPETKSQDTVVIEHKTPFWETKPAKILGGIALVFGAGFLGAKYGASETLRHSAVHVSLEYPEPERDQGEPACLPDATESSNE